MSDLELLEERTRPLDVLLSDLDAEVPPWAIREESCVVKARVDDEVRSFLLAALRGRGIP